MAGGNWRQKVNQGDKLSIPAFWFNDVTDTMLSHKRSQQSLRAKGIKSPMPEGLIWVQNNSGATVNRFGVLGLDSVIITDSQNLAEFQNNWALTGVMPTAAYVGQFCIAWEPIAAGAIGRAFVFGTCSTQVKMGNVNDLWADVLPGDATQLQSGGTGSSQILFTGQPISSGSSTYWCIIRFQAGVVIPYVRPTATLTGRGWYSGFECPQGVNGTLGTNALNPASDLSPANFNATYTGGSIPTGTVACYIMNIREAYNGASGSHAMDLAADSGGSFYPRSFPAIYLGQSTDGQNVPCYLIDGVQDQVGCPSGS